MNALSGFSDPRPARKPSISAQISDLARELVEALDAEVRAYLNAKTADDDRLAQAATDRVWDVEEKITALPRQADLHPDFRLLLAVCHQRWLVAQCAYTDGHHIGECRFVDAVLAGSRFEHVPLLWHINGESRGERPSDAELLAATEAAA